MSDSFLTDKLAEVRSELTRLHLKEALLVKAVLAGPDLATPHLSTVMADHETRRDFANNRAQSHATGLPNPNSPAPGVLRPRPGWPMVRAAVQTDAVPEKVARVALTLDDPPPFLSSQHRLSLVQSAR